MKATRNLLPYERPLAGRQLRRWRTNPKFDLAQTELNRGSESVRLLAAWQGGFELTKAIGILGVALVVILGKFFGLAGAMAGFGVVGVSALIGAVSVARQWQSESAREEHQRSKPLMPREGETWQ